MIIVNFEKACAINFDVIPVLYVTNDGKIRTEGNTRSFVIGEFSSYEIGKIALKILINHIQKK